MRQFLFVIIGLVLFACGPEKKVRVLPFAGNFDIETYEQDGEIHIDTIYPKIPKFQFTNQDSTLVRSTDFKGKIMVANFFFTSCPNICPPTMSQVKRVNKLTQDLSAEIQFLSFSIDPKQDQPSVLKQYLKDLGFKGNNWTLLTGNEVLIHDLGVNHFMVHASRDPQAAGGFAHADGVVLVDKEGYVRGIYRGTQTNDMNRLAKDIRKLLEIEYGIK